MDGGGYVRTHLLLGRAHFLPFRTKQLADLPKRRVRVLGDRAGAVVLREVHVRGHRTVDENIPRPILFAGDSAKERGECTHRLGLFGSFFPALFFFSGTATFLETADFGILSTAMHAPEERDDEVEGRVNRAESDESGGSICQNVVGKGGDLVVRP